MTEVLIGTEIAASALQQLGTPFRLHGRIDRQGLDCVGLVASALRPYVSLPDIPCSYTLRGEFAELAERYFVTEKFQRLDPMSAALDGDILMVRVQTRQLHFMVCANGGVVHAHAGLRRVVWMPTSPDWPVVGHWRFKGI